MADGHRHSLHCHGRLAMRSEVLKASLFGQFSELTPLPCLYTVCV